MDAWLGMCWTAEAAWECVTADAPMASPGDATVLRPLAARLRFLVLSEPMRWRGQRGYRVVGFGKRAAVRR